MQKEKKMNPNAGNWNVGIDEQLAILCGLKYDNKQVINKIVVWDVNVPEFVDVPAFDGDETKNIY